MGRLVLKRTLEEMRVKSLIQRSKRPLALLNDQWVLMI
jgi:hypothetical protein